MKYLVNLAKEVHNFDNKANIFNQLEELEIDNDICLEYIDNRGNTYFYNNKISNIPLFYYKSFGIIVIMSPILWLVVMCGGRLMVR